MGKFKVGDKVRIRKDSEFYGRSEANPADVNGVVISVDAPMLPVRVEWGNGEKNAYEHSHLEPAQFTKADLKDGMRCETRGRGEWFVCDDRLLRKSGDGFERVINYSESLHNQVISEYDIIKVTDRDGTVLFEREPEVKEMTVADIERELGYSVKVVK